MSKLRLAFLGFRHAHVAGLFKSAKAHPRVEVIAAIDENPEAAAASQVTHGRYDEAINSPGVDAVAIGEVFGRRGEIIISALKAGKHVIADKPICTRLDELEQISAVASQKKLAVGCLLDLRDHGPFLTVRRLIRDGAIGAVHTVNFTAQHPLLPGKRPAWYFEPGMHGGTINDIGIHAIDLIPWLTGRTITESVAARAWNARVPHAPHFHECAQMMLKLDNNGGVLGDLSYLAPETVGYSVEPYWRTLCHGEAGSVETNYNAKTVTLAADNQVKQIPAEPNNATGCLDAFLDEIDGRSRDGALTTAAVLDASRRSLLIQRAADEQQSNVNLSL